MYNPEEELKRITAKNELRKLMAVRRDALSREEQTERSQHACEKASELMKQHHLRSMMIYVPFRSELDTRAFVEWAWENGIQVIVPRSVPQDHSMELYELQTWNELSPGAYGILEPDPGRCRELNHEIPDIIWVPGLAFDRKGGRLGYGGGYYDRLSDRLNQSQGTPADALRMRKPCWVGLGYEIQVLDHVPMNEHDRVLDGLVTDLEYTESAKSVAEG